ncbi:MAG: hypothetical protein RLZZ262_2636 [Bacteroidota bacterium]|jgi:hypothetical protein
MKIKVLLLLTLLISSTISCSQNSKEKPNLPKEYQDLLLKVEALKTSMISYMETAGPDYTEQDVDKCVEILNEYIEKMVKTKSKQDGLNIVKSTVLELNKLNKKCGEQLIETGEREQIAEIIILTGHKKGYNSIDEDITEEWREW